MTRLTLMIASVLTLSACMDGGNGVVKAKTGVTSCPNVTGISQEYLTGPGVRCGPQSELPYTLR